MARVFLYQPLYEFRHLRDMLGGAHEFRLLDIQKGSIFEKRLLIFFGVLLSRHAGSRGVGYDFVGYVGNVHHVADFVSALPQESAQNVYGDKRAEVADVPVVVHCRSASVHADFVVLKRAELLDFSGQSIEQAQRHGMKRTSILGGWKKWGKCRPNRSSLPAHQPCAAAFRPDTHSAILKR